MTKARGRWFSGVMSRRPWKRTQSGMCPVLVPYNYKEVGGIPESIARMVYSEYTLHNSHYQSFNEIMRRGGFGPNEIIAALADIVEREEQRSAPNKPKLPGEDKVPAGFGEWYGITAPQQACSVTLAYLKKLKEDGVDVLEWFEAADRGGFSHG